jgi:hypothetical protein
MIFKVQQTKVEDCVKDELIRYDLKAWKEKKMMPYDIELLSNRIAGNGHPEAGSACQKVRERGRL